MGMDSAPGYQNILVVQTAFLGDVILITPLIRGLRHLFPESAIDVLLIPQTSGVLQNNPNIRDILTFDKRKNKLLAFIKTYRLLKSRHYDLAVTPHSSTTTAFLLSLAGIPRRLGFDRWHAARYLTDKVPHFDDRGWHKIRKELHLLTVFSKESFSMQTELFPNAEQQNWAEEALRKVRHPGKAIIALAPGSVWNTKRWPQSHYSELCRLLTRHPINLIFIGGAEERELCDQIIEEAGLTSLNFAGQTKILESAALIARSDLVVCNDSGALHMANAMKTDVFAFFGPTVQSIGYFPYREGDRVFELEMDCRPCGSHGGQKCPLQHHRCMNDIQPQTVYQAIVDKLKLES